MKGFDLSLPVWGSLLSLHIGWVDGWAIGRVVGKRYFIVEGSLGRPIDRMYFCWTITN